MDESKRAEDECERTTQQKKMGIWNREECEPPNKEKNDREVPREQKEDERKKTTEQER